MEYVEVTVKVPKKIVDFLEVQKFEGGVKAYLENNIVDLFRSDIDSNFFFNSKDIINTI